MKKIFLTFFALFLLIALSKWAYANECSWGCKIADGPSPLLEQYMETSQEISTKVLQAMSEHESESSISSSWSVSEKTLQKRVIRALNGILSFKEHYGSFDYWVSLGITNEVPAQVKRDHRKLTRFTTKMTETLKKASKRWSTGAKIENVCEWIENCNLPKDVSAGAVITDLIKNNQLIIQLYQASVLEKPALEPTETLKFVGNGFVTEIKSYYNKDTLAECSKCKDATFANISEKIKNISFKNGQYKQWVAKWKAAWAMLRGWNTNPNYEERERQLLAEYLEGQWLDTQQSDIILWNLDRYNESGLSSSDPLTNSSNYAQANIEEEVKTFAQTLEEKFAGEEKVPVVELTRVNTEIKATEDVAKEIHTLFDNQKPYAFTQDTVSMQIQGRLLRMHFSLVRSINMLGKWAKDATKACEKPGPEWRCNYNN